LTTSAAAAGSFSIGGQITINRLGFGAMRITGPGIWGEPADRAAALSLLRRLPELGVNFIDTADSYGPHVSEQLIREALHPYKGLTVATKAGLTRSGPDRWSGRGDPAYLYHSALESRERLGVDRIDLWQLHRIDPAVPRDLQFAAVRRLLDQGIVRFVGLSEVSVEDIQEAQLYFPVATVQNLYSLADGQHEAVLQYCEANGIGFIPFFPLAAGKLAGFGSAVQPVARARSVTPAQIALAWLLKRSPVMIPIPGTSKVAHLEENVAAAAVALSDAEFASLSRTRRGISARVRGATALLRRVRAALARARSRTAGPRGD
jgi:aryl-alcohol dehydrogenase-like predicted oxidoreductase